MEAHPLPAWLVDAVSALILAGLPFLLIVFPVLGPKGESMRVPSLRSGVIICTILVWWLVVAHWIFLGDPLYRSKTPGIHLNPGAVYLGLGWMMALIVEGPFILLRLIIQRVRDIRHEPRPQWAEVRAPDRWEK